MAYAIGRAVGPAVTRNRLRRRLRSLLQQKFPHLPSGLYLIGATPAAAQRSYSELMFDLERLMVRISTAANPTTNLTSQRLPSTVD